MESKESAKESSDSLPEKEWFIFQLRRLRFIGVA
jgi:hypothetical protein